MCGSTRTEVLENHHVVPKVVGGSDEETNLITLCGKCHGIFHGARKWTDRRVAQQIGIQRARKEGKFVGRKPLSREIKYNIIKLVDEGLTKQRVADTLKIGVSTVYRTLNERDKHLNDPNSDLCY
jgi:hypothetical protein